MLSLCTAGLEEKLKAKRKFGEARKWHGFTRYWYTGFIGYAIQSYFTLMASALKRPVEVLELGVRPEPML